MSSRYIGLVGPSRRAQRRARIRCACRTLFVLIFALCPVRGRADPVYEEADVKAVLIARVVSFIRWSEGDTPKRAQPLVLTVIGDAALAARLATLRPPGTREGKLFQVRSIEVPEQLRATDVLFIGRAQSPRLERIIYTLGTARTLTVADMQGAASRGVAINLYPENGRMRLEINPAALKRAGLTASYQLMNLGRVVSSMGDAP